MFWEYRVPTQIGVEKEPLQTEANEYCIQDWVVCVCCGGRYVQNKFRPENL